MATTSTPPSWRLRAVAYALVPALVILPAPIWWAGAGIAQAQPSGLPDLGESSAQELSPRLERRLGEAIMVEARRDPAYIEDAAISQYLNAMATRLAAGTPGTPDISIFAVRDATVNAFAMPGGFIGIHAGLVVAAQTEAELAGVMAHEIGHVAQRHIARGLVQQKQDSLIMVAALLAALIAARGNSQAPQAALAFGQAAAIDSQLGFSREAEREADRTGFQMLQAAGYDVSGMAAFFGRLLSMSTANEGGRRSFASTHPLSIERMSDMQNRARGVTATPQASSADFYFARAKLRALQASSGQDTIDAIRFLESRAQESTGVEKAAYLYGSGVGHLRRRDIDKARQAYEAATSGARDHFMLAELAIDIASAQGDNERALSLARSATTRWPEQRSLTMSLARALQATGRNQEALAYLQDMMQRWSDEPRFYQMAATSYGALNRPVAERRVMADYYAMTGALPAAVELLTQARSTSKDFYEQSQIDAKVRELQRRMREEKEMLRRFES